MTGLKRRSSFHRMFEEAIDQHSFTVKRMKRKSIHIHIELDGNSIPEKISWEADDAGFSGEKVCSSMSLGLWDEESNSLLAMELWTSSHSVDNMKRQIIESLYKLSDTCQRATNDQQTARKIVQLASELKHDLIRKQGD